MATSYIHAGMVARALVSSTPTGASVTTVSFTVEALNFISIVTLLVTEQAIRFTEESGDLVNSCFRQRISVVTQKRYQILSITALQGATRNVEDKTFN